MDLNLRKHLVDQKGRSRYVPISRSGKRSRKTVLTDLRRPDNYQSWLTVSCSQYLTMLTDLWLFELFEYVATYRDLHINFVPCIPQANNLHHMMLIIVP